MTEAKIGPNLENSRETIGIPNLVMHKLYLVLAVVTAWLFPRSNLQAGLYHRALPAPHPEISSQGVKPLPAALFRRDVLEDILKVSMPQTSEVRSKVMKNRDELLAKARSGRLTEEDQVNLSGFLIRLGQYQDAIDLLTPVATRECRNFMIFANLATAEQHAGQLERAVSHLQQAQDVWPQELPGLSREQLNWFRQVEKYHLLLVRHRWAQARQSAQSQPRLDPLFVKDSQPVRYVGDSGQYEAGKIAAAERAKLPPDALAILQQLLIWLPDDTLLYWQYGELLNANGDVISAAQVFDDCRGRRRFDADELKEHRQIVAEAAQAKSQESMLSSEETDQGSSGGASWLPDRNKLWAAGTIFALIVVVLIYFQIREIRRRRRAPISRK
jgi:tetratricopeptide (TPR) repeat protein